MIWYMGFIPSLKTWGTRAITEQNDYDIITHSDSVNLIPVFESYKKEIEVDYADKLDPDYYNFWALACNWDYEVGRWNNAVAASDAMTLRISPPWTSGQTDICRQECCTKGRKYAGIIRNRRDHDIVGVQMEVETPQYGLLCKEPDTTVEDAFSVVWTGISYETYEGVYWVQIGFGRTRNPTVGQYYRLIYYEIVHPGIPSAPFVLVENAPITGETHTYIIEISPDLGRVIFNVDNDTIVQVFDYAWEGMAGTRVEWSGEIYNFEDDMLGTNAVRCWLRQCKYTDGSSGWFNGFRPSNVNDTLNYHKSNPSEWDAYIYDEKTLQIWDKNTL